MANIPQKVTERLVAAIKKFQLVLAAAHERKANESDTVIIITSMLTEAFGYDTFNEITSEIAIRGIYCDLAAKIGDKIQFLIEAKTIAQDLKDNHVTQAVVYAASKGVDWVVLTNGLVWQIHKVIYAKPVDAELIVEIDFAKIDHHNNLADLELLFLFTKESCARSALSDYYDQKQALSCFTIGQVLLTEPFLAIIKRELKRISPDVRIDVDQIRDVLEREVLNAEVITGVKAQEAHKRVAKAASHALRAKSEKETEEIPTQNATPPLVPAQTEP